MRRCCGGLCALVLRLMVVTAAIGGLVTSDALAKSFPPNWPQSPGSHPAHARLARSEIPAPVFSSNLRGGYAIVGNTLLTCPENLSPTRRRAGRASDAAACLNANNNDKAMKYVNVDPVGTSPKRFNSSTATVSVPAGARVVRAFLYWGADLARGVTSDSAADGAPGGENPSTNTAWRTAFLKTGAGSYTMIDAQQPGRDGLWKGIESWYNQPGNRPGFAYQVRADVTNEIRAALASTNSVNATVANVQAGKGNNRHGGWTLVVVWENDTAAWRNLTLFDGFDFVQVSGGQELVVGPLQFKGFQTASSGPVDAHVTTWTYEADRSIVGDYMSLGAPTNSCSSLTYRVSDAVNPVDNFFNSTISRGGVNVTSKLPNYQNQLGYDLDAPSIPEGTIHNGATGAAVCLGTTGDTYFFGGLAFDTLIRAPNLGITKTVDKPNANPGDVVTYTVTVSNPQRPPGQTPTDVATNVVVSEPIPSGLEFDRFVINPPATPLPIGRCAYNVGAIRIDCKVGTLQPDGTFTYSYQARVSRRRAGLGSRDAHEHGVLPGELGGPAHHWLRRLRQRRRRRPACAGADRRSRRDEDGLGDDRQAGRQPRLDARCTQLRARRVEQLHRDRRASEQCRLRESGDEPERPDVYDAARRLERHDHLHGRAGNRSGAAGARQRVHAHDRRAGLGRHRRRNGARERRHRLRHGGRAGTRPASRTATTHSRASSCRTNRCLPRCRLRSPCPIPTAT